MTRLCASSDMLARRRAEAGVPIALVEENAELKAEVAALKRVIGKMQVEHNRLRTMIAAQEGQRHTAAAIAMGMSAVEARVYVAITKAAGPITSTEIVAQAGLNSAGQVREAVARVRRKMAAFKAAMTVIGEGGNSPTAGYRLAPAPP